MLVSDEEILKLINENEEVGMRVLFKRYYIPMVLFADSFLHDTEESEDIVQDHLVKLWYNKNFKAIKPKALSSFLFTITKNACINALEKRKLPTQYLSTDHNVIAENEAVNADEEEKEMVLNYLENLPPKMKSVIESIVIRNMSYKQVAEEMGISVNTVKSNLRDGISKLRNLTGIRKSDK